MSNLEQTFENIIEDIVDRSLVAARSYWISEAQSKLKTSRESYIAGISEIKKTGKTSGYVELTGAFPKMTEEGYSSFDIKQGFSKSIHKKTKPDGGWYLTVPYRHRTSVSPPFAMPADIMKGIKDPRNKGTLSEAFVKSLGKYERGTSHTGYRWKNTKYDNLVRILKIYKSGRKHSTYLTFRRVSNTTDPKAWVHPGFKGLKAVPEVARKTEEFIYESLENLTL